MTIVALGESSILALSAPCACQECFDLVDRGGWEFDLR